MIDHAPSPESLQRIGDALMRANLSLLGDAAERARLDTYSLAAEYLAPRLEEPGGALVVAVAGVSGSGKSTLVNSLARRRISHGGTRRPTTIEPVAWTGTRLPPTLDALRRRMPGRLVDTLRPPPEGIVVVDTPPPGVVDERGERIASQILAVADVCVLVAGASRYADAAGFEMADQARDRGMPIIFVLNRTPTAPEPSRTLVDDYTAKLSGRGLLARPDRGSIVAIAEGPVSDETGGLPGEWIAGLRKELEAMAEPVERAAIVREGIERGIARLEESLSMIRSMLIVAESRRVTLLDPVRISYGLASAGMLQDLRRGEFAETADDSAAFVSALASGAARRAGRAARTVAEQWAGIAPDLTDTGLFGHGPGLQDAARDRVASWMADISAVAAEVSGRPVRRRRIERFSGLVRRMAVDRGFRPDRKGTRLLARHPGASDAAVRRLEAEIEGIFQADSTRFTEVLGFGPPDGLLADLMIRG
ncbi:MAG TPA: GTPase domain-containing protein [Acidimicrobiia bacterium]|nr:GTPase domain-containing protein [Acidimicrobiia bacterium]